MIVGEWMDADQLGLSQRDLRAALRAGSLVRVRRGRYLPGAADPELMAAARLGCRLDCVSFLRALGVFILDSGTLHVLAPNGSSRLPAPGANVVRHWRPAPLSEQSTCADFIDAVAQSCRCQKPRAAIATLDSAVHLGLLDESDLADVFARLPRRLQRLRPLIDSSSESGAESLMRLILRSLGCSVELQVQIQGVGRVDFVVDGWLIIECDSRAHHEGWGAQRADRRRDLAAAALGFTTVRPLAEDIFFHRDVVREQIRRTLARGARR